MRPYIFFLFQQVLPVGHDFAAGRDLFDVRCSKRPWLTYSLRAAVRARFSCAERPFRPNGPTSNGATDRNHERKHRTYCLKQGAPIPTPFFITDGPVCTTANDSVFPSQGQLESPSQFPSSTAAFSIIPKATAPNLPIQPLVELSTN